MNIAIHVNSTDNCGRPHWQYTLHYWINTLLVNTLKAYLKCPIQPLVLSVGEKR